MRLDLDSCRHEHGRKRPRHGLALTIWVTQEVSLTLRCYFARKHTRVKGWRRYGTILNRDIGIVLNW